MKNLTLFLLLILAVSPSFAQFENINIPLVKHTATRNRIIPRNQPHPYDPSGGILLTFEGMGAPDFIMNFYNGGTSLFGYTGTNYGVSFSPGVFVGNVPPGNEGNMPSPYALMSPLYGNIMNVPAGFATGISFYYCTFASKVVRIYDGPDGTGNLLASYFLAANMLDSNVVNMNKVEIPFSGTAKSVVFPGHMLDFAYYDDIALGDAAPPSSVPTLSQWGLIIFAFSLVAFGSLYILRLRGGVS